MERIDQEQLNELIKLHQLWLNNDPNGKRLELNFVDLSGSDLSYSDLRGSDLSGSNLSYCNLRGCVLSNCNLKGCVLSRSDLRYSDLSGSNLDYSCWSLWCGSFDVKVDRKIFAQLAYHLCRVDIGDDEELKAYQKMLLPIANEFHRVNECGHIVID